MDVLSPTMIQAASTSTPGLNIQTPKTPTQQGNSHIKAESQACCGCMPPGYGCMPPGCGCMPPGYGCMPPGYGCMPPDNAPEIVVLQSCYLSSLVLAVNDRESTIHLGVKELGSNGLTFPQEIGWSARSASTNFFYLAAAKGGLHFPALTSLF